MPVCRSGHFKSSSAITPGTTTARDRLQEIVRDEHAGPSEIAVLDETGDVEKGDTTPATQRQRRGAVSKTENSILTVHLAHARDGFHRLLDGELFLPEAWTGDRNRCREASIAALFSAFFVWRNAFLESMLNILEFGTL